MRAPNWRHATWSTRCDWSRTIWVSVRKAEPCSWQVLAWLLTECRLRRGVLRVGRLLLRRRRLTVLLLGLLLYYVQRGDRIEPILIYVAVVGSIMVSYARARAEGLGVECKEGLFTRFERVILLVVGLVVGVMRPVLWVLAILTVFTAIQRIYSVWRKTLS